jgi:hypothetical protein
MPAPELRYEHTALWVEFRFLPEHIVSATPGITGEVERLVLRVSTRTSPIQQRSMGGATLWRPRDHGRWGAMPGMQRDSHVPPA